MAGAQVGGTPLKAGRDCGMENRLEKWTQGPRGPRSITSEKWPGQGQAALGAGLGHF